MPCTCSALIREAGGDDGEALFAALSLCVRVVINERKGEGEAG